MADNSSSTGEITEAPEAFLQRAEEFFSAGSLEAGSGGIEHRLHTACIAVELSLKAVLLRSGWTDDRNRREIRHDLLKAIAAAGDVGFTTAPDAAAFAERFSAPYSTHRLAEAADEVSPEEVAAALRAVATHLSAVRRWLWSNA